MFSPAKLGCLPDAACRAAHPTLLDDYQAMLKRVADVRVPSIVHRAARGDFEEYGVAALNARGIRMLSFGMFLSVSCTDDIARIDAAAAKQSSAGTLLGTYRVEQQIAACQLWPRGTADPMRATPLRSSIPTLLLSGEFDPVTPSSPAPSATSTSRAFVTVGPQVRHRGRSSLIELTCD